MHPLLRLAVYEQIPPARRADDHRRAALSLAASGGSTAGRRLAPAAGLAERRPGGRRAADEGGERGARRRRPQRRDRAPASRARRAARTAVPRRRARPARADGGTRPRPRLRRAPERGAGGDRAAGRRASRSRRRSARCSSGVVAARSRPTRCSRRCWRLRTGARPAPAGRRSRRCGWQPPRSTCGWCRRWPSSGSELRALADAAGPSGRGLKIFDACWSAQTEGVEVRWWERLEEGLDGGRFVAEQTGGSPIVIYAALVLVLSDEVERAEALLADIRADARARGSIISHLVDLAWGAFLRLRTGRAATAAEDAREALDARTPDRRQLGRDLDGRLPVRRAARTGRARSRLAADRVGAVEDALGTAADLHALLARGRLRAALGDREGAIRDLVVGR